MFCFWLNYLVAIILSFSFLTDIMVGWWLFAGDVRLKCVLLQIFFLYLYILFRFYFLFVLLIYKVFHFVFGFILFSVAFHFVVNIKSEIIIGPLLLLPLFLLLVACFDFYFPFIFGFYSFFSSK